MRFCGRLVVIALAGVALAAIEARELSLEERVAAQRAIEQVHWNHRIWPEVNPGPKPPLSSVMSDAALLARVEDYLAKSRALEKLWLRPIAGEQLQAEMDRMAAHTRDPRVLGELFAALGHDPLLIAETLARQTLADRLVRSWYASDSRFHGEARDRSFESWWAGERGSFTSGSVDARGSFRLPAAVASVCANDTWSPTHLDFPDPGGQYTAVWTGAEMLVWGGSGGVGGRYNPSTDTWTLISTGANAPATRSLHTAVWTGTRMIVWGGQTSSGFVNNGGLYDPSTDTWLPTSTGVNVPSARRQHSAVWTGTQMIVWGGVDTSFVPVATGGRYDPASDAWTATSTGTNVPAARGQHTAVWTGTQMVVWGGLAAGSVPLDTGGRYNPSTDAWLTTSTAGAAPTARSQHTAIWTGTVMIVWGGFTSSSTSLNTGGRYNPATNSWAATSTGANVPSARSQHSAVWTGTVMIVWGGSFPTNTGGRYNPSTNAWTTTSIGANVPVGRHSHVAVWTGTEMIVWGGFELNNASNSGGRYSPATDSWVATSTGGSTPWARFNHAAVWTGTEMIVWGGLLNSATEYASGGRYTPSTDSWVATSMGANAPTARYWPGAVWTGTEMIVWGGTIDNNATFLNTGGRYAPTTDSWTSTSTGAGVPTGRVWHSTVWTGTEMIVWGGSDVAALDTGGRYAPGTDSWIPTAGGVDLPVARYQHTAVWTGTEMIVWGGTLAPPTSFTDTGGRYDPAAGSWTPTSSAAGVVAPRTWHTAVWTEEEMIVWGGMLTSGASTDTGARYAPSTDSWMPTPTGAGAPEGRSVHTAVWTGAEMVVWGGASSGLGYRNTGGRYAPLTDSWALTSTGTGVPIGRAQHTAVWTGAEMIVWGGYPPTATGGVYCACGDPLTVYRDTDGDEYGDAASPRLSCDGSVPEGYAANDADCDDGNADVHPAAAESCNDVDDDCDDEVDEGFAVPESAQLELDLAGLLWSAVAPGTGYDVVRGDLAALLSSGGDFTPATLECLADDWPGTSLAEGDAPDPGAAHWYLVRAVNCTADGTWNSGGASQQGSRDGEIAASAGGCP